MASKSFVTRLDTKTISALKSVSKRTRIPQSELVREGIAFVLQRHSQDAVTAELKEEIDGILRDDSGLLKRLSKA
jgi:hypothetical protein